MIDFTSSRTYRNGIRAWVSGYRSNRSITQHWSTGCHIAQFAVSE